MAGSGEGFSREAAGYIRLRLALYGEKDAKALMMRCFKRSKADRISVRTVLNAWQEQDDALDRALGFDPEKERAERKAAFLARQEV